MSTPKLINPSDIFSEMLNAIQDRRESERRRSRESSRKWRTKQDQAQLRARQRQWERDYRTRLKDHDPEKYQNYCKGNVDG